MRANEEKGGIYIAGFIIKSLGEM